MVSQNTLFPTINESENTEFKLVVDGKLPNEIWAPISAFSNADGGTIYFGVDKNGNVIGVDRDKIDNLMADIASYCRSTFNHKLYPGITTDANVVKVFIPPVPAVLRPIYSTSRGIPNGGKVRVGTTNSDLDDHWIRQFTAAANGGAELVTFNGDFKEYFDDKYINYYLEKVKEKRGDVYKTLGIEEILIKLRAINNDKKITMFGLLSFSNMTGLQELTAPTVNVAVTQYSGASKVNPQDVTEVSIDDKEFYGNTVEQFQQSLIFIMSKLPIRSRIEEGGRRQEYLVIPEVALREILANAIAHRDYSSYEGRVQVDIYSDRIEFSNPGRSLVPIDQLENAHPQARNPLLMSYLKDIGITEHRGRGIRTIKSSLQQAGLSEPTFEHRHNWFVATVFSTAFIDDTDQTWLQKYSSHKLNSRQLNALVYIKHNDSINNSQYRTINNMNSFGDDRRTNWELGRMVLTGVIKPVGDKRYRKYIIVST